MRNPSSAGQVSRKEWMYPKLMQTLQSFATKSKVAQAEALAKKYGVNSVPTLVVGRKYRTSPGNGRVRPTGT